LIEEISWKVITEKLQKKRRNVPFGSQREGLGGCQKIESKEEGAKKQRAGRMISDPKRQGLGPIARRDCSRG